MQAAFANDGIGGQDLTELNCRRLEKMLARQGCDDASTVAQAVLAVRDSSESTIAAAVGCTASVSKKPHVTAPKKVPAAMLDVLKCGICCERYGSCDLMTPRILPCGHTFCEGCLTGVVAQSKTKDASGHRTMACPGCRAAMKVPKGGAGKLIKNYLVGSMTDAVA